MSAQNKHFKSNSATFYSLLKNVKSKTSAYQLLHAGHEAGA